MGARGNRNHLTAYFYCRQAQRELPWRVQPAAGLSGSNLAAHRRARFGDRLAPDHQITRQRALEPVPGLGRFRTDFRRGADRDLCAGRNGLCRRSQKQHLGEKRDHQGSPEHEILLV